jgi:hypothetical protein
MTDIKHRLFKSVETREGFLNHVSSVLPDSTNSVCVEIGVMAGVFSKLILNTLKPKKLFLIDPWEVGADKNSPTTHYQGNMTHLATAYSTNNELTHVKDLFSTEIKNKQVELQKGFSYDIVHKFPDKYFDFIYIDATHIYECVKADLTQYLPKLKDDGLMCGHDYSERPGFSVIPAVDEFVSEHNFSWVCLGNPEGDWALSR